MTQLKVLQFTDTHLFTDSGERLAGVDTWASFEAVLQTALAEQIPDLLLFTGDLAQTPSESTYARLHKMVGTHFPGEVLYLPGNHDDPAFAQALFARRTIAMGSWRIVGLNSRVPDAEGGSVADSEFSWLRAQMRAAQEPNLLIAVHHPPLELGFCLDHGRIDNGGRLLAELGADARVRGLIHGHVHQAATSRIGELWLLATPSTCVQFKPLSPQFALDTHAPGYRWLDLMPDGRIETGIERLPAGSFPATLAARKT